MHSLRPLPLPLTNFGFHSTHLLYFFIFFILEPSVTSSTRLVLSFRNQLHHFANSTKTSWNIFNSSGSSTVRCDVHISSRFFSCEQNVLPGVKMNLSPGINPCREHCPFTRFSIFDDISSYGGLVITLRWQSPFKNEGVTSKKQDKDWAFQNFEKLLGRAITAGSSGMAPHSGAIIKCCKLWTRACWAGMGCHQCQKRQWGLLGHLDCAGNDFERTCSWAKLASMEQKVVKYLYTTVTFQETG